MGLCVADHEQEYNMTLATMDRRAVDTHRALGVEVEFIGSGGHKTR